MADENDTPTNEKDQEANGLLLSGLGVAAIGAIGAIAGAACPLCVVATPALLGFGAFRKWQARKEKVAALDPSAKLSAEHRLHQRDRGYRFAVCLRKPKHGPFP